MRDGMSGEDAPSLSAAGEIRTCAAASHFCDDTECTECTDSLGVCAVAVACVSTLPSAFVRACPDPTEMLGECAVGLVDAVEAMDFWESMELLGECVCAGVVAFCALCP